MLPGAWNGLGIRGRKQKKEGNMESTMFPFGE